MKKGIDISRYQGTPDFAKLKDQAEIQARYILALFPNVNLMMLL